VNDLNLKKIVILFPEYLGDFMMLVPFIHELKNLFPNSMIDIYTSPVAGKLAKHHPAIDHVFERPSIRNNGKLNIKKAWKFSRELKNVNYDIAYFTNDYMFWPLLFAGVGSIIQEQKSLEYRLFCKGTPNSYRRDNLRHASERHVNNIEHAFNVRIPFETYDFSLNFPDSVIKSEFIPNTPYIYLNADGNSVKKYHPDFYKRFCKYLLEKGYVVLIDGLSDRFGLDQFKSEKNVIYAVGKTSLYEMFGLIKNCTLLVSVDSGPSHVACMFQKKSLVLHPPKANFPFKTAGFYKDNWSYKLSPSESKCPLHCSVFQACKESYCEEDYEINDVIDFFEEIMAKERTWKEKEFERYQKSVGVGVFFSGAVTKINKLWIDENKNNGFFMFFQENMDLNTLTFKEFYTLIKKHRLHLIFVDGQSLSLKFKLWDWWCSFSEKAYIKILPKNEYDDLSKTWFNEALTSLKEVR
jgi:heptosyltransferase II